MAGSRALPDLVARIRVDSSGVDQAIGSLIGSFGRADIAMAGVAAGIGLLVVGGKSMIDIAERHDAAQRGLEQAYSSAGVKLSQYQGVIDSFINSNRRYISDQSEVVDGYAKLTRSGLSQTEVQRAMNDAVDLAALKHISLSEAVGLVDNAEHGRMRGLIDLGITTAKYTDAEGNLILANHSVAKSMDELDVKLKGGRDTLTQTQQISNKLANDWQDLANKGGPVLLIALDAVITKADDVYSAFDRWGKDDAAWAGISARMVDIANWIKQYILEPLGLAKAVLATLGHPLSSTPIEFSNTSAVFGPARFAPGTAPVGGKQFGGSMIPGRVYTVGETEEETVMMHPGGGATVIPSGKGSRGGDIYHFHQVMPDPWAIANEISWSRKTKRL